MYEVTQHTHTKKMKANTKGVVRWCQIAIPLPVSTREENDSKRAIQLPSKATLDDLLVLREEESQPSNIFIQELGKKETT